MTSVVSIYGLLKFHAHEANIKIVCIFNIEMFSIWKTFDLIRSTSYMISGPVRQWLTLAFDLGQTMPVQVCIVTSGPHQMSITASNVIDTDARQQHYSKPHPFFCPFDIPPPNFFPWTLLNDNEVKSISNT